MNIPSNRLENKETTNFLVKAIKNYCIIDFFLLADWLPNGHLRPLSRQQSLLPDANHCVFSKLN